MLEKDPRKILSASAGKGGRRTGEETEVSRAGPESHMQGHQRTETPNKNENNSRAS